MGIGKQVADAYIEVHGDLSKFRNDLDSVNGTMEAWATKQADAFGKAWGERTRSQLDRQWNSVIDMMHSGKKVDFNRMIEEFDSGDIEEALDKINDMLDLMDSKGKISADQMGEVRNAISTQMDAIKAVEELEVQQSAARDLRSRAYRDMLKDEAAAKEAQRKMDAAQKKMLAEAYAMDQRYNAGRMKMLAEAYAQNERFNAMKKKFNAMMRAQESKDLAEAYAENKRFDALKRKVLEISRAEEARMIQDAIRDNEAWAKSYQGVMHAASKIDLEQKFKNIGFAMETNDWSRIAQGAKNMSELRNRTTQATREMVNLGRMTEEQFAAVQTRLNKVAVNLGDYNVKFGSANKAADEHGKSWTLIQKMVSSAGKKFAGFSGLNVLTDIFREGASFFQNLDRNAVNIGKMALQVGTLGSAVVSMIGGVAVVGQDLAKIGQIGILAPAFLTGAAISAGVLIAALKDMGNVLGDLKPRFEELQNTISTNFWAVAEGPIRNLVDTLLPTLSTKLGETSTALGGMFAALADSLASISTEDISVMFDRMNAGIVNATGAIDPLVQAFNTMSLVGSLYFEQFGTWITNISTQFNDFIQSAAADGRLQSWIEEAISSIQSAWSILGSGLSIFNAIGDAAEAAGIGGLFMLAVNLEKVAAIMNSSEFQTTLTQLFAGAAEASRTVAGAILELGPAIQSFMPTLTGALTSIGETVATVIGYIGQVMSNPTFQKGLTDFITGVQKGVDALGPAIGPMADSLGQVGTLLGQVAGQVGELVAAFVVNLSPVLDTVTEAFGRISFAAGPEIISIIETMGEVLGGFVDTVLPPLENLVMTVLPLIAPAFEAITPIVEGVQAALVPFIDGITQLVEMIAPVLIPALERISEVMAPVIEIFTVVADALLSVLIPVLGTLLIDAINSVVGVFEGFAGIITGVVDMVVGVFNGFRDVFVGIFTGDFGMALDGLLGIFGSIFTGIWEVVTSALQLLWNAVELMFIGKLITGIKTGLTSILEFFTKNWDDIVKLLAKAWENIVKFVTEGLTKSKDGVTKGLKAITDFFKKTWDGIVTNLVNVFLKITTNVKNGIQTAKNSVTKGLQEIRDFFKTQWDKITGTVSGAWTKLTKYISDGFATAKRFVSSGLSEMITFFKTKWDDMATATSKGIDDVVAFVKDIPTKIKTALGDLGATLKGHGTAIIDGFLAGLKAAWTKVTDFVGGLATWISNNKGPISYDKVLLIPAGNAIMEGLGKGLRDKLGMLKDTLGTVTDTMTDSVTDAFAKNKMYLAGADAALGLADGLKSNKRAVAGALDAVMPAATTSISASLVATGTARVQGADSSAPAAAAGIIIEAGAIVIQTPTKNPEIVAEKVIDEFANYSNL